MRMLFVTYRFPVYSCDASSNTVFNLVKYFSRKNEVSLVGLAPAPVSSEAEERLAQYCRRFEFVPWPKWRGALHAARGLPSSEPLQMWYYRSREFAAKVRQIIAEEQIELAYGYHLRSGQFLADLNSIPRVLAIQPAQILHFGRRFRLTNSPFLRLLYGMEYLRLRGYEAEVAAKFDSCLLISPKDREAIDPNHRLDNVFFNPHGTDVHYFAPPPGNVRDGNTIAFSGSMFMDTNTHAALYFHREILPLIWAERPHTRFMIVGKNPPRPVLRLAEDSRVTVTGFVPDLRPYLWKAAVGINPVRMAAGMQNKLIEGLAAGLPMVISPEANEGIHAPAGKAVLVAHSPQEFAASVLALLDDPARAGELGAQGQAFVQADWSWEHHFEHLDALLQQLAGNRVPVTA
ncbi:MAG TPA: glycosyltransferase [Acidobacteriaceae bacterium]|nr:glycosyltransferase [Acidobacteriaceae bacterium]